MSFAGSIARSSCKIATDANVFRLELRQSGFFGDYKFGDDVGLPSFLIYRVSSPASAAFSANTASILAFRVCALNGLTM
jgi:hypothetical protein